MFDTNGDGMISIDELEGMMSKFGDKPEQDELNKMMKSVDTDGKLNNHSLPILTPPQEKPSEVTPQNHCGKQQNKYDIQPYILNSVRQYKLSSQKCVENLKSTRTIRIWFFLFAINCQ